jgi:MEMO1 family protein
VTSTYGTSEENPHHEEAEMSLAVPCAVLMCHAPIVLPEVGRRRSEECSATTRAMRQVARRLVASDPHVLVVISPHSPRRPEAWGLFDGPTLSGDFGAFGAPEVAHRFRVDAAAVEAVRTAARAEGLATWTPPAGPLDHGAMVPLHFVAEAGWAGPTVLLSMPWPGTGTEPAMGRAIARAAESRHERWSVLASGDMSHRLKPGAPSGFHPRARDFDLALVDAVTRGDLHGAATIDPDLREIAAEDAVDSLTVAAAAVDWDSSGHERLCYEGPFGVGYMEAVLHASP